MNVWFYIAFTANVLALAFVDNLRTNCRKCYGDDFRFDFMSLSLIVVLIIGYFIDLAAIWLHIAGSL